MSSYATPTDLSTYGVNAAALQGFTTQQQQAALDTAASVLDGYLGARFQLPLRTWGSDIRRACSIIAAYDLLMARGFDPDPSMASAIQQRFDSIQSWLRDVASQKVVPVVQDSSALAASDRGGGGPFARQAQVVSSGSSIQPGLSIGGAPPSISDNGQGGQVVVSQPSLRGW